MTSWSERLYWKTRAALLPDLENSQLAYAERLRAQLSAAPRWLDVGCGHAFFPDFVARRVAPLDLAGHRVVGIDPDRGALAQHRAIQLKVNASGEALPFRSGSFDLVTANMVLEHIDEPARLFAEVSRVLAPSGRFLVHTPNKHGYTTTLTNAVPHRLRSTLAGMLHGRDEADVYRTYYRANTDATLRNLARAADFNVARIEFVQTSPQLIAIPPLMMVEMLFIRTLSSPALERLRACVIAAFEKA